MPHENGESRGGERVKRFNRKNIGMPNVIRDKSGRVYRTVRINRLLCEYKATLIEEYSGRAIHVCTRGEGTDEKCRDCPAGEAFP